MTSIFVSRKIIGGVLSALADANFEVDISQFDRPLTAGELLEKSQGKDALLTLLTDKIDGEFMDAVGPQLKLVSNYAVGFDNIDVEAATQRGIVVANTPCDEVNEAVAEHTWALILSLERRIVEADEATRRGSYRGWEPNIFLGKSLKGKTLGIVGMGRIGGMVAKRASGFGLTVLYNKRSPDPELEKELGVAFSDIDGLYAKSDIVTLHVPLTDETRGMINEESMAKMKDKAVIINTARGPIVKEQDLVNMIRKGKVGGAALDVFENEPNINPELIGMENVILTPHIASATEEARDMMGKLAVEALIDGLSDRMPKNIVNKEVWEKRRK